MFSLDGYQSRCLETTEGLNVFLNVLGQKSCPILDKSIKSLGKSEREIILADVLEDAEKYNFTDDDELLVRYAIYSISHKRTPMNSPELASVIRKSETILLGIRDQMALAEWAVRSYELFGMS